MTGTQTTCPYCGVGCGVVVSPDGKVTGDVTHPANFGRLCSKGSALGETLDDTGRLLLPSHHGQPIGWGEALDRVADGFSHAIAAHGPDSVAFYASGQFLTEDYYVANKLMKGFIGSGNIDTNSRLCMASSVAGHVRAFGEDVVPGVYEDWDEADLVVIVGGNTAWCHPVLFQRLTQTRARRGTKIVVIDPRRTATCEIADLHLPLAAGSDVALFNGLFVHIAASDSFDAEFVGFHTSGIDAAFLAAGRSADSIAQVAKITGLPEGDIQAFYELFAATERVMTVYSQGVNQSSAGTDKVNAIINCHLATGRIGRPGMGPFSVTGQPNAMGGREVGGLSNQLAAHMSFDNPADVARVGRFWNAPRMASGPGLKAVDLFDAVLDGRIKAIWIMATNPAVSMPQSDKIRRALEICPLVVVSDCWDTDTTALADIVLPAAAWGEKDGTVTNSERRISRQRPFRDTPGQARPDWWIMTQVARRMGWRDAFSYKRPAEIFREHAALTAFENDGKRLFDIGGLADLTDSAYADLAPVRWPVRKGAVNADRLFGDGAFPTPNGRARFAPTDYRPPTVATDRRNRFMLNTGRIRDQWHTMTRTGLVPRLMRHEEEPHLDLHPIDAASLGVEAGDLVRVGTAHGTAILRARPNDAQRRGEVFAPMHWTDRFGSTGPIDRLAGDARDPFSGQPELKATPARLAPIPTLWRGFLLTRTDRSPAGGGHYHARIPLDGGGNIFQLLGWDNLPDIVPMLDWASSLLGGSPEPERGELVDPSRGIYRFARLVDGRLDAFLALTRSGKWPLPDRTASELLLGVPFDENARHVLFSIEEASAAPAPRSPTVCACFSVAQAAIEEAVIAKRLTSVAEIGAALSAGTNCGSCIPELKEILRHVHIPA